MKMLVQKQEKNERRRENSHRRGKEGIVWCSHTVLFGDPELEIKDRTEWCGPRRVFGVPELVIWRIPR
jgi:hypothetical protein